MAGILLSSEYLAFASFTYSATTYYVGTGTEYRSGNWYDGVVVSAPQLAMTFGDDLSLTRATNVDLEIGDGASGIYRALATNNILAGTQVSISLVMRKKWSDGTTTENVYTQQLTVCDVTLQPSKVILHLQDIEEQKLQTLYPPNTWQAADWPELSSDDAGKPICEAVGMALKLPCVLLQSDSSTPRYVYAATSSAPKDYSVTSINSGAKQITINATPAYLYVGQKIFIRGSTAADGVYTIVAWNFATVITVAETLPASTGGTARINPHPVTVYRNKRIVSPSEYSVLHVYNWATFTNPNFASGTATYRVGNAGTGGSVTATTNNCTIVAVNGSNFSFLEVHAFDFGVRGVLGAYYALRIETGAGADVRLFIDNGTQIRVPANTIKTLILPENSYADPFFSLTTWNFSGTCVIKSIRIVNLTGALLSFSKPQIDFNGTNYVIEADCAGVEVQNASSEIYRLLTNVGATADTTSFNAAASASFAQTIDCDYGRSGQRRVDAIIDDLLYIARGGLSRNGSGAYTIWQDKAGSSALTLDESVADTINVSKFEIPAQPISVAISYAPSSADASQMQVNPLSRGVTGGILGADTPRELRYLRDAVTADQLICYRALRRWRSRTATATIYQTQVNCGDIITVISPRNWPGTKLFTVWDVSRVKSGNALSLKEYDPAVYTYTAATLPPTAPTGYQPDYSFTPPAAPTSVSITATVARVDNDGTTSSYVTVQALPPSVNWQQIWFAAVHNVTGEITLGTGTAIGGGLYGCTIAQLRPGEVYKLQCYAVNNNNLQGIVQSTFDSTAIGGAAGSTTFTTAGQTNVPATVASIAATQGSGKIVNVAWSAVAGANVAQYVVERQVNGGAFAQVYSGRATAYVDTNVIYSSNTYVYRVRAQDTYGNFSAAYATTSPALTLTSTIFGGATNNDIAATTVATANRTNTSTASTTYSVPDLSSGFPYTSTSVTHSLGRKPILGAVTSGSGNAIVWATSASTSTIGLGLTSLVNEPMISGIFNTENANVPASPGTHQHQIKFTSASGTASVDYW